jgi:hypothetical protein
MFPMGVERIGPVEPQPLKSRQPKAIKTFRRLDFLSIIIVLEN